MSSRRFAFAVLVWSSSFGCGSSSDAPSSTGAGSAGIATAGAPSASGSAGAGADTGGASGGSTPTAGTSSGGDAGAASSAGANQGGVGGGSAGNGGNAGSGGGSAGTSCSAHGGGPTTSTTTHLDIGVHDPALIWNGTRWVLFGTGGRLSVRSSSNLQSWNGAGDVFAAQPAWIKTALGSAPADLWAPDVSYFDCAFHVYYAGSSFGSNNSVIGLATSPTLDSNSPSYKWKDEGQVLRSSTSDDYNAIDPNVAFDETGAPWLSFGSFWSGIKLRKLDPATGKPSSADSKLYAIAGRNGGAIEAPSIVHRNGFYYLFVSYDSCCKGTASTYRTMVGRASKITGPYANKAGALMTAGAAEQLLASSGRYIGPGGGTAFQNGTDYLYAFHYYDGNANGAPKLQVRPIDWDANDWPTLGEPLFR